ncbi:putative effector protein [Ceratobasidium theobromae]|uniref:Putative effector protein n=1 Tax=Ceratobasidium theobromae TaxID=1582974 RepID=A0A5N5QGH0_9AGAM|nr:putative effector protein [Ceratobasidium theobromae]
MFEYSTALAFTSFLLSTALAGRLQGAVDESHRDHVEHTNQIITVPWTPQASASTTFLARLLQVDLERSVANPVGRSRYKSLGKRDYLSNAISLIFGTPSTGN